MTLQCNQRDCMSEQVQPKVTPVNIMQRLRCVFLLFLSCVGALRVSVCTYVFVLMYSYMFINFIVCKGSMTILQNKLFSALLSERSMKIANLFTFCAFYTSVPLVIQNALLE